MSDIENTEQTEKKLEKLLSIEQSNHSHKERTAMIMQGVNWLTLLQELIFLYCYRIPLSIIEMIQKKSH